MKRKPLVAGNWKMYTNPASAGQLAEQLGKSLGRCDWADIAIFPPYTSIGSVITILGDTGILIGGQNIYWENEGAFTGEISAAMLRQLGCRMVIIGHSERRMYFGETDAKVLRKTKAALGNSLQAIVCIGETLEQRESGITEQVVESQLVGGLGELNDLSDVILAYEPVWAIGTGRNATPEQASDVHKYIREIIYGRWGKETAESIRILYGGSVKPDNSTALWEKEDIDGFLVGGASLKADSFTSIAQSVK